MGLSTVSQNLNLLEQEGLIEKNGFFESTGGRKANALQIVSDFKISIGIGILKGMFHITAVDLYGNAFYTDTISLPYSNTDVYKRQVYNRVSLYSHAVSCSFFCFVHSRSLPCICFCKKIPKVHFYLRYLYQL